MCRLWYVIVLYWHRDEYRELTRRHYFRFVAYLLVGLRRGREYDLCVLQWRARLLTWRFCSWALLNRFTVHHDLSFT